MYAHMIFYASLCFMHACLLSIHYAQMLIKIFLVGSLLYYELNFQILQKMVFIWGDIGCPTVGFEYKTTFHWFLKKIRICNFLNLSKTFLLKSQQQNIPQRPFWVQYTTGKFHLYNTQCKNCCRTFL